jgi:hypothetical protein
VTALLYFHELGHVIGALLRGVRVIRAPVFIPGLGAFVRTGPRTSAIDDLWVSLSGPMFGGALSIVCVLIGAVTNLPWLAQAGAIGIFLNLFNLAPIGPLDGGRVVALIGPLGSLFALGLGVVFLSDWLSPILVACFVMALLMGVRSLRQGQHAPSWSLRLGVLAAYGLTLAALFAANGLVAVVDVGPPPRAASLLYTIEFVALAVFCYWIASRLVVAFAWKPERSGAARYWLLLAFNWWWYLLEDRRWLPLLLGGALVATDAESGLPWLERRIVRLVADRNPLAGGAVAIGYDALARSGDASAADRWLTTQLPALREAGPDALGSLSASIERLGHEPSQIAALAEPALA